MQRIATVAFTLVALGPGVQADEIYRWTDKSGRVHISNAPSVGDRTTAVTEESLGETAPAPPDEVPPGTFASTEEANAYSTDVSVRRNALERELRATEQRLGEIDGRLATLARLRTQHAGGIAATGGVGTNAAEVRSDEERALETERDQLRKRADELRASAGKLRDEVSARLGGTPAWWNDVR
jgi:hypothetical protein